MRICLYGHFRFPSSKGTPLRLLGQATALAEKGHEVTVICLTPPDDEDIQFIALDNDPGWFSPLDIVKDTYRVLPQVRNYLKSIQPDVVHAHVLESAIIPSLAAKLTGTPFVYEPHGHRVVELIEEGAIGANSIASKYLLGLENVVLRNADGIVALSPDQLADIESRVDVESTPTRLIVGGCHPPEFLHSTEVRELSDSPVVAYVGNLREWQGVEQYSELVAAVIERHPIVRPAILTNDRKTDRLVRTLEEYDLAESCIVVEQIDSHDLPGYLNGTDVLVAPTPDTEVNRLRYPSKMSIYLASTAPVVANNISPYAQVINDGETGILYDSIAEAVDSVSGLVKDPERRASLGAAGRNYARRHLSWETLTGGLEDLYDDVAGD